MGLPRVRLYILVIKRWIVASFAGLDPLLYQRHDHRQSFTGKVTA